MWILNAFSINMLPDGGTVRFEPIEESEARDLLAGGVRSAVGHETTAAVLSRRLGIDIPVDRAMITLGPGDAALVAQMRLDRRPEGDLPSAEEIDATPITWVRVEVVETCYNAPIESDEFDACVMLASDARILTMLFEQNASFHSLISDLRERPEASEALLNRITELVDDDDFDPQYRHPADITLAAYIWALHRARSPLIDHALSVLTRLRNGWWARKVADSTKERFNEPGHD